MRTKEENYGKSETGSGESAKFYGKGKKKNPGDLGEWLVLGKGNLHRAIWRCNSPSARAGVSREGPPLLPVRETQEGSGEEEKKIRNCTQLSNREKKRMAANGGSQKISNAGERTSNRSEKKKGRPAKTSSDDGKEKSTGGIQQVKRPIPVKRF